MPVSGSWCTDRWCFVQRWETAFRLSRHVRGQVKPFAAFRLSQWAAFHVCHCLLLPWAAKPSRRPRRQSILGGERQKRQEAERGDDDITAFLFLSSIWVVAYIYHLQVFSQNSIYVCRFLFSSAIIASLYAHWLHHIHMRSAGSWEGWSFIQMMASHYHHACLSSPHMFSQPSLLSLVYMFVFSSNAHCIRNISSLSSSCFSFSLYGITYMYVTSTT